MRQLTCNSRSRIKGHFLMGPLLFAALLCLAQRAHATGDPPAIINQGIGTALSRGMATFPIHKGELQIKLSPMYVTVNDARKGWSNEMDGFGFTAAATYGLSEHWGVGFIAGYAKLSGDRTLAFAKPD